MASGMLYPELAPMDVEVLLEVAAQVLRHGLQEGKPLPLSPEQYSANLRDCWPVKVSLSAGERELGSANLHQRTRPLVSNVAALVYAAAFLDRKSPKVCAEDLDQLSIRITVLGLAMEMSYVRESDLAALLQPGIDALAIRYQQHRAMLWPDEWRHYPEARAFITALKGRISLAADQWPGILRLERYCSVTVEAPLLRGKDGENSRKDVLGGTVF